MMKKSVCVIFFIFIFSFHISSCTTGEKPAAQQVKSFKVDKNYLLALNTADSFLVAWLNRDYKNGVQLLTERAKSSARQEDLMMLFTGISNPHHQAFEVVGKEYIDENTISFQVWLYEYYTGEMPPPSEKPAPYSFNVIKVDGDTWLVDTLPERTGR